MDKRSTVFSRDRRFCQRHNFKTALRVRVWKSGLPLLQKFDVRGRVDLMLEAANILPHESVHPREQKVQRIRAPVAVPSTPVNVRARLQTLATIAASSAR